MSLLIAFIFFSLVMFCVGMRRGWFKETEWIALFCILTILPITLGFVGATAREEKVELPHSIVEVEGVPYCVVPSLSEKAVKISSPNAKLSFTRKYNIFGLVISTTLVEE